MPAMIPMVDLKTQYLRIQEEIDSAIGGVLESTAFIMGPNVAAFEKEAAAYLGVPHAIGCASGTDALHLALKAAGVRPGDEVITSAFTFIATAEAICYTGAKPVFVDIDPQTFNITPKTIAPAITSRTRAVMPVHLFGQPADLEGIGKLTEKAGLLLIEDCAQSFGATLNQRQTGSFGIAAGFSFFPSKNLGAYGDGGLVTSTDSEVAGKIAMLRNHGSKVRYHHDLVGYNSRLDELQAAILRVKLRHIDEFNSGRCRAAHLYSQLLSELGVETPYEDGLGNHVYHQYTILTDHRDAIMTSLQQEGIASAVYYPVPLHRQNVFLPDYASLSLPVTEAVSRRCMSLPIYPELEEASIRKIVSIIGAVING